MLENDGDIEYQIALYLEGKMSEEEMTLFTERIEKDGDLAEKVNLYQQLNSHLSMSGGVTPKKSATKAYSSYFKSEEAHRVKNIIEEAAREYHVSKKKFFPRYIAAAVIGLMICVGGYLTIGNKNNLYDEFYTIEDLPSLSYRGDSEVLLKKVVDNFQNENFKETIIAYQNYISSATDINVNVYLYSGLSYLSQEDFNSSLAEFDKLIKANVVDSSKGLWFKSLVYLKMKDREKSKQVLKIIVSDQNNFNYQKAVDLLSELN